MCGALLELPDPSGNPFGCIQFSEFPNTSAFTKKIQSVTLALSRPDKQPNRRTDVSVLMGAFLQQFLAIETQLLKPVNRNALHFVALPCFRPTCSMSIRMVLPNMLYDIEYGKD
jgi:hypothetical protein